MAMERYIEVLNPEMRLVALLGPDAVLNVSYVLPLNGVPTLSFALPGDDEKNQYCDPGVNFIRVVDQGTRIGPFEVKERRKRRERTSLYTYQCDHVLATLVDDILPGYHQVGNLGMYTRAVLEYILSYQSVKRWMLGRCAFARQFEYGWSDENLLAALWAVPKPFTDDYMWSYDMETTPWTLHLDALNMNAAPTCYIRYKKNLLSMEKTEDATNLCTMLWARGNGEGVNQVGIAEVNGGVPYLLAPADVIKKYRIRQRVFVDRRFESPEALKARAQVLMDELQKPYITYAIQMADLHSLDGDPLSQPSPGKITRVTDTAVGEDIKTVIKEVSKPDAFKNPAQCGVVLANKSQDIAGSIADLADRQRIEQLYAQGAPSMYAVPFFDNAGPQNPALLPFYVPERAVVINEVRLHVALGKFRAYETGAETAGSFSSTRASETAGQGIRTTTTAPETTQTSTAGGELVTSTNDGGASAPTTAQSSETLNSTSVQPSTAKTSGASSVLTTPLLSANPGGLVGTGGPVPENRTDYTTATAGVPHMHNWIHNHDFQHRHNINHTHDFESPSHSHQFRIPAHSHTVSIPNHRHSVTISAHRHEVRIPSHWHEVSIPGHTHDVRIEIPGHAHKIIYGIYEGGVASSYTVSINGKPLGIAGTGEIDIDIAQYMADAKGNIPRGQTVKIAITPNALTRIEAVVTIVLFLQSHTGANY